MSLYRKYRPQTFADVVGQEPIVTTLENAAEQNKLSNAYLFAGSRGTGKTSVARILAKILMIQEVEDEVLQKQIIQGVEEGTIVDLLEIDGASTRGIDDVRDLIEKIQFSPVVTSAKVYIIDEVHMLTKEAFNALLKTLEEPPEYAYFILATTELNKIPATIQSRCQCFPFRRIREEDIIRRLQYIADQEHITIERDALRAIAHHVEGGLRDAISLLDQMRSLAKISLEDVEQRIGSTGLQYIEEVFSALTNHDAATILQVVRKIEETGAPLDAFLRQMLRIVREKLHIAIEENQSTRHIIAVLDTLLEAIRNIRISPVPGVVLEAALISLCTGTENKDTSPLLVKEKNEIEEINDKMDEGQKKEEDGNVDTKKSLVEAPELTVEAFKKQWGDIVKETSPASVKMSLKNGRIVAVDEKKITVSFSSAFHRDTVSRIEASIAVEKVVETIFKRHLRLHCVLQEHMTSEEREEINEGTIVNIAEAAAEVF